MRPFLIEYFGICAFSLVLFSYGEASPSPMPEWDIGPFSPCPEKLHFVQHSDLCGSQAHTSSYTLDPWAHPTHPEPLNPVRKALFKNTGLGSEHLGAEAVSISSLLSHPHDYHGKNIRLRGTVTQPELHVSDTGLFINFVFVLREGPDSLIVFGQHDRTKGDIQITMGRMVEVVGVFWEVRVSNGQRLTNNLEASHVIFFPPLTPDEASKSLPRLRNTRVEKNGEHPMKHHPNPGKPRI